MCIFFYNVFPKTVGEFLKKLISLAGDKKKKKRIALSEISRTHQRIYFLLSWI